MSDTVAFAHYYITITLLGLATFPLAKMLLPLFPDKGWIFSKISGVFLISYITWLGGMNHFVPFTRTNSLVITLVIGMLIWGTWYAYTQPTTNKLSEILRNKQFLGLVAFEELLFLTLFAAWAVIRAYNPDIHGLEKYMDYGFMLSILRAEYFPPIDHFFASEPINYYYFGHHMAATITQLSGVLPNITYNLQIALIFALTFTGSFSIVLTWFSRMTQKKAFSLGVLLAGLLGGTLTAVTGNLHTILNVRNLDTYWYATATRLIPFTINEFPVYSFIVADLHAHMNNIPQTLLAIAIISHIPYVLRQKHSLTIFKQKILLPLHPLQLATLPILIGSFYPTNAWDFPIYLMLLGVTLLVFFFRTFHHDLEIAPGMVIVKTIKNTTTIILPVFAISILAFLPFWFTVKPISDGIGIVKDLSPAKEFFTLWGMYLFLAGSFTLYIFRSHLQQLFTRTFNTQNLVQTLANTLNVQVKIQKETKSKLAKKLQNFDILAVICIALWLMLLVLPELIYVEDIYKPDYYRANTMFKLYYAGWVLVSIATAYGFSRMVWAIRMAKGKFWLLNISIQYLLIIATLFYPYMAIKTVTNSFATHKGLDGTKYLEAIHPDDAIAIDWINDTIIGQPVILEAVGESYTDYARIASNTGLPTVLGWPVHEWLWRGTYGEPVQPPSKVLKETGTDTVAQRVDEVATIYTTDSQDEAEMLLDKYNVRYIYVGNLEREKYPTIKSDRLRQAGEVIFETSSSIIVKRR